MPKLDIRNNVAAVDELLLTTENPLHRQILENWRRHSLLEVCGRWPEILSPELTVDEPHYRMYLNGTVTEYHGKEEVGRLYGSMTDGGHSVVVLTDQDMLVGDRGLAYKTWFNQYYTGADLVEQGHQADPDGSYIRRVYTIEFWKYDRDARLLGEYVAEMYPPEIVEIDPSEVISPAEARAILDPLNRALPVFAGRA